MHQKKIILGDLSETFLKNFFVVKRWIFVRKYKICCYVYLFKIYIKLFTKFCHGVLNII